MNTNLTVQDFDGFDSTVEIASIWEENYNKKIQMKTDPVKNIITYYVFKNKIEVCNTHVLQTAIFEYNNI